MHRAGRARAPAATNGSPPSCVLNPAPASFRGRDRNAANQPQLKATGVTRFWLGRSVARWLLGLATTGKAVTQRRNRRPLLAGNRRPRKAECFPKKQRQKKLRSIRRLGFRRRQNLLRQRPHQFPIPTQ